jgi:hypothetical protein
MSFIVFNTVRKAEHYVNYRNFQAEKHNSYEDNVHYFISGNKVIQKNSYEWYCSASDPDEGYVCCSDYRNDNIVIGRIKNLNSRGQVGTS